MARSEVKWGALLSYALMILNSTYGLVMVPFILGAIGESEYGVFKTIGSMTSAISVIEVGVGGTLQRYIAKYRAQHEEEKSYNFSAMCVVQAVVMAIIMVIVGAGLFFTIEPAYADSFTLAELIRAKQIFVVLVCHVVIHSFENVLTGIITGYNRFVFSNGMKLFILVLRILIYIVILPIFKNSLAIVLTTLGLEFIVIFAEIFYVKTILKHRIKLYFWDKVVFRESFKYTFLMFITGIAALINNNLDNVIVGAIEGTSAVSVYSMGLLIFNMFMNLSTVLSSLMLPTVANVLQKDSGFEDVQVIIVRVGRIQFMLLGAALVGFTILGNYFIDLWLGEGYDDVYIITLILMIPALFELCVNVCLSVLRVKNMLGFRTGVLFTTTFLNAVVTVVGVKLFGYYAAAVGTAFSFLIGSVIIMNIYYCKKLSFRMPSIYKQIFSGTWICLFVAGIATLFSSQIFTKGWIGFVLNVAVFGIVYAVTMLMFGLRTDEKKLIPFVGKFIKM